MFMRLGSEMYLRFKMLIAALLVCSAVGCTEKNAWVYVDNGTSRTMTVQVNGVEVTKVAGGACERIVVPMGSQEFRVKVGRKTIYHRTKVLKPSEGFLSARRYLLNPDRSKRYWTYTVRYGGGMEDFLYDIDKRDEVTKAYERLVNSFAVMPASDWFSVPEQCSHVLEDAPDSVTTKRGRTVRIPVLNRVSKSNYRVLQAAKQKTKTKPTEKDIEKLGYCLLPFDYLTKDRSSNKCRICSVA